MKQYRKRPVVVNAVQNDGSKESLDDILRMHPGIKILSEGVDGIFTLIIPTLEASVVVNAYDWVVQDVDGAVSRCKDAVFQVAYEMVDDDEDW